MAEIFISYSQKDKARVRLIAESLEGEGFDVFWDPEIAPGETWDNVIARELKAARCVIVAWSESSAESDWVKEEAEFGKRMKALVPVQIDESGPPLGFSRIQTADLSTWTGDPGHGEWRKVLDRVRHHGVEVMDDAPVGTPAPQAREASRLNEALYREEPSPPPRAQQASAHTSAQATGGVQTGTFRSGSFQTDAGQGGNTRGIGGGLPGGAAGFAAVGGGAAGASGGTASSDPAVTFDFPYTFFTPKGRLSKKPFWIGFAILFGISFLGGALSAASPVILIVVNLVMLYPGICLYGKRLHDFGMSAWIYGGYLIANFVLGALIGGAMGAGGAFPEEIAITTGALGFLLTIGFTLWVGLMKTQPTENKHGPVPGSAGVSEVFT